MHIANAFVAALFELAYVILDFYVWVIIAGAILSWLVMFGIINTHNRFVSVIGDLIYRLTEPVYSRLRRIIPPIGGLDLAPLALIFLIMFLQFFMRHLVM
jgi:YggT family protein